MPAITGGAGGRGRCSLVLGVRGWALFCSKQGLGGGRRRRYVWTASRKWVDGAVDGVLTDVAVVGAGTDLLGLNQREESLCLLFRLHDKRVTAEGLE